MEVTDQRKCHQTFSNFFSQQDGLGFCNNVAGLFEVIGITCKPSEWRLFIDSSSQSLKTVLLHNGNNYPSLLVAHSVQLKEDYTSVKMLLSALKYDDYGWEVIGDFKKRLGTVWLQLFVASWVMTRLKIMCSCFRVS